MRSSIAIAAAIVGAVNAAPGGYGYGGYGGGYESVVYSTSLVTVTSCGPEVTNCPAKGYSTPAPYVAPSSTEAPAYSAPAYSAPAYSAPAPPAYSAPAYSAPAPPAYSAPAYSAPASPAYSAPAYSAPAYSAPAPAYSSSAGVPYITKTVYTTSLHTVISCAAYVTNCPAHSTIVKTEVVPAYTTVCPATESETYPISTPVAPKPSSVVVPVPASTPCTESSTVTVVVPVSSAKYPIGTGAPHYPTGTSAILGTASSTGSHIKPSSYPPTFTGAASHANAGMAVAGLGAIAAMFL